MGCKTLSTFYERWDGLMFKWNFVDVNLAWASNCNLIQYEQIPLQGNEACFDFL